MSQYQSSGIDFDSLFQARTTTAGPNTSYQQNGVDLAQTYEKLALDQQIPNINYQEGGVNLSTMLMGNVGQYTLTADKHVATRTTGWVTEVVNTKTITFASASARTNLFLYGGRLKISGSRTGGTASSKNTDWTDMFNTMGTIEFGNVATYKALVVSDATGNIDLTSSYATLYNASGSGSYAENQLLISARSTTSTTIDIRFRMRDNDAGDPTIDETVNGTMTNTLDERRHPTQASPTYSGSTTISGS